MGCRLWRTASLYVIPSPSAIIGYSVRKKACRSAGYALPMTDVRLEKVGRADINLVSHQVQRRLFWETANVGWTDSITIRVAIPSSAPMETHSVGMECSISTDAASRAWSCSRRFFLQ